MNRRVFLSAMAGGLFAALPAAPCAGEAQQSTEPRLCLLTFDPGKLQTQSHTRSANRSSNPKAT